MATVNVNTSMSSQGLVISQTTLSQTRTTTVVNGLPGFSVFNVIYTAGQLPDTGAFLVQITDPNNVSTDALARVCTVPDVLTYSTSRSIAIANGQSFYRQSTWTATYTDLDTASAGAQAFKDKTSKLTADWINFTYSFNSPLPGKLYSLPVTDPTTLANLVNGWIAAHANTIATLAALTTASQNVTTAQNNVTTAQNNKTTMDGIANSVTGLVNINTGFQSLINAVNIANNRMGTKPSPYPATSAGTGLDLWTSFSNLLSVINNTAGVPAAVTTQSGIFQNGLATTAGAGSAQLSQLQSDLTTALNTASSQPASTSALTSSVTSAQTTFNTALTSAQTALTTAQNTQTIAQATYNQAVSAEAAALTAVQAVYPSFDTSNPLAALAS